MLSKTSKQPLKKILIGVPIIALLGFVALKVYPIIHGPDIHLTTINNGAVLSEPLIELSGRARYTKDLVINGSPMPTSPNGAFQENLLLHPGYNVISIQAHDRFGNQTSMDYALVLHEADKTFTIADVSISQN